MNKHSMAAKILGIFLVLAAAASCTLFQPARRDPLSSVARHTPEAVARGEYLFRHVGDCAGCHAMVNPRTHALDRALPVAGGALYTKDSGVPGKIYVPNITPAPQTGLGGWSDGEIVRALREGVSRDGRALFPMMPYASCFRVLSDDDALAIVAYIRTLAPVEHVVPARELDFPVNLIVNTIPEPLTGPVPPPAATPLEKGRYLVRIAGCAECHTPRDDRGQPLPNMSMAGGHHLRLLDLAPGEAAILMPNLTPDGETGLGRWTDDQSRVAMTEGVRPDGTRLAPQGPAAIFHDLAPEDVSARITYLRTVTPVRNPKAVRVAARAAP